ncbi:protein kinase family protein [Streptosporangium soli]|nr:hypothetical protein [Streptosporangium sp. KLBMP 9127]
MNAHRGRIAGFRLAGRGSLGEVGTWSDALAPDGSRAGALLFDEFLVAVPGATQRLAATVAADRRLTQGGQTGLLPIVDLVAASGEVWLLTGHPASPAVADLLTGTGGPAPDAGSAATVLVESAQTLLAVHAAGLAHGSLQPGNVVIGDDGATLLAERGLNDALRGRTPAPEQDVAAWASLARALAPGWAGASPAAAELIERAATTSTTYGLAAARDLLVAGREHFPDGFAGRDRLVAATRWWRHDQGATDVGPTAYGDRDEGEIVTLLHVPSPVVAPPVPAAVPSEASAPMPVSAWETDEPEVRFGPGLPTESTAEQIWRAGRQENTVHQQERRSAERAASRKRRRTALSAAVFALVIAGAVLAWLLLGGSGPTLAVSGVDVKAPKKTQGCDSAIVITGVITTNGADGQVRYEWRRSDRKQAIQQTEAVRAGTTSYEVNLRWTVKGEGSFKGTATLRVLSPPGEKRIQDKATFTYRCR